MALALDLVLGEPPRALHPVVWMGNAVKLAEKAAAALARTPRARRLAGVATAAGLPAGVYFATRGILRMTPGRWRGLTEAALMYTALAARSLAEAAQAVDEGLDQGLPEGRSRVSCIVGRDTTALDEAGVVRAAVESVAENANDGVVAPAFYGLIGGAPLALAYKMVNTLDSMIGYRSDRYRDFGWAAARLDDAAGFIPARLTALAAAAASPFVGASAHAALRTWRRDAAGHPSPNAGVCESAFAGALGVRLGGARHYGGEPVEPHVMGSGSRPPAQSDIGRAVNLMQGAGLLMVAAGVIVRMTIDWVMAGGPGAGGRHGATAGRGLCGKTGVRNQGSGAGK